MQGNLCYVGSVRDMAGPPFQIPFIHSSPTSSQGWPPEVATYYYPVHRFLQKDTQKKEIRKKVYLGFPS